MEFKKGIKTINNLEDSTLNEIGLSNIARSTKSYDKFNEEAKKLIENKSYTYISKDLKKEKEARTGKTIYKHLESVETNDTVLVHETSIFYDYDTYVVKAIAVKESSNDAEEIIDISLETLNEIGNKQSFITRLTDEYKKFISLNLTFKFYPYYTQDGDKFTEVLYNVGKPSSTFDSTIIVTKNTLTSINNNDGTMLVKRFNKDTIQSPLNNDSMKDIGEEVIEQAKIKNKYMVE
jgi:hypothetical protein